MSLDELTAIYFIATYYGIVGFHMRESSLKCLQWCGNK